MHHLAQRLGISAVGAGLVGADGARRRIEAVERARLRIEDGEAAGERLALRPERIGAGEIEHEDTAPHRDRGERAAEIGDAERLDRHARVTLDRRVHRHEIILAVVLEPVSREVDEGDRVRARGLRLLEEIAEGTADRILVEVAGADDVEAGLPKSLRHEARVIGGGRERPGAIIRVADDERDPRATRSRWRESLGESRPRPVGPQESADQPEKGEHRQSQAEGKTHRRFLMLSAQYRPLAA